MKQEKVYSSFTLPVPEVENIYELVVVASMRARQLNQYPHLRDLDQPKHLVEQALKEAFGMKVEYGVVETVGEGEEPAEE